MYISLDIPESTTVPVGAGDGEVGCGEVPSIPSAVEVAAEYTEVVGSSDVNTEGDTDVTIEVEGIAIIQRVGIGMAGGGL